MSGVVLQFGTIRETTIVLGQFKAALRWAAGLDQRHYPASLVFRVDLKNAPPSRSVDVTNPMTEPGRVLRPPTSSPVRE